MPIVTSSWFQYPNQLINCVNYKWKLIYIRPMSRNCSHDDCLMISYITSVRDHLEITKSFWNDLILWYNSLKRLLNHIVKNLGIHMLLYYYIIWYYRSYLAFPAVPNIHIMILTELCNKVILIIYQIFILFTPEIFVNLTNDD